MRAVGGVHPAGVDGEGPGDVAGLVAALAGADVEGVHLEAGDEQGAVGDHGRAPDVVGHPEPPRAPARRAGRRRGDPADPVGAGGCRLPGRGLVGPGTGPYPDGGAGQPDLGGAGLDARLAAAGQLLGGSLGVERPAVFLTPLRRRRVGRRRGRHGRPGGGGLGRHQPGRRRRRYGWSGHPSAAPALDQVQRARGQPVLHLARRLVPGEQVRGQLGLDLSGRRPVLGGGPHAGPDEVDQLDRQPGQVRLVAEQLKDRLDRVGPPVGGMTGRAEDQQRAEREDVARAGDAAAVLRLLGRHVGGGADRDVGHGQPGAGDPGGDPEVDHARAVLDHQHVGRLEVTVHQPGRVDGLQRLGDPGDQPADGVHRQRPALLDQVLQRGRRYVGGGEPGHRRVGVGVHHGGGVETADRLGGGDLTGEADPEQLVLCQLPPDGLDGHPPPGRRTRQVHQAHPARAEPPQHLEGPDPARIVRRQLVHSAATSPSCRTLAGYAATDCPMPAPPEPISPPLTRRFRPHGPAPEHERADAQRSLTITLCHPIILQPTLRHAAGSSAHGGAPIPLTGAPNIHPARPISHRSHPRAE